MTFSNKLSDAELERLAILAEELGEAQQIVGKIIRHGYNSRNPLESDSLTNRSMLTIELGDIIFAINQLTDNYDIDGRMVGRRVLEKAEKIKPYLHHQAVGERSATTK